MAASLFGLECSDLRYVIEGCDVDAASLGRLKGSSLRTTGFWRVDKEKDPELRHTVLTLVAFQALKEKVKACGGDRETGIEAFLNQNDGWMLPEMLRLADYGLGHDERAKHPQPVASRLGPRFYDWQLAQDAEESWRECHLHARNLLREDAYSEAVAQAAASAGEPTGGPRGQGVVVGKGHQETLFQ